MSFLTSPSPFIDQVIAPSCSFMSYPISTLGMVRPLTLVGLRLHPSSANTPTSASFMPLTDSQLLRYGLHSKPTRRKSTPECAVHPKLSRLSSKESTQPSATLSYLDPSKLKRKRMDISFILSSSNWDAHEDPIYGYTRTDFDYKA